MSGTQTCGGEWAVAAAVNEGIHLDLDTWIVPGQIRKANLCRGLGNRYTPAGTEVAAAVAFYKSTPAMARDRLRRHQ